MKKRATILAMLFVAWVMVSTAFGEIILVDADAIGANNGSNWADAFHYLQDALAIAQSDDEIRVAQGVYKPDQSTGITPSDREATFQLKNGVTIKGGYAGFGEPDPNARDIILYETILSSDLAGNDRDVNDPQDFLNDPCRAENSYHVVTGSETDESAVLDGFTITAGNANGWYAHNYGGGGMYNYVGSPTVTNCKFSWNSAICAGGGMFNYSSSPIVTNCKFTGNSALSVAPLSGGGGMYNCSGSSPKLNNCTLSGNSGRYGGGMHNWGSSPTLTNCTLSGNHAQVGGGISFINPPGGHKQGAVVLTNCILWCNRDSSGVDEQAQIWGSADVNYSCIQGLTGDLGGTGNIGEDPSFVRLGYWNDNGTPADPSDDYWVDGDYHLLEDSPCINAGDPNYIAEPNETDFDGKPRIIGRRIDMGAHEYSPPIPAEVRIVPRSINMVSKDKWITCYIWLPEGYDVADTDCHSLLLEHEIEPEQFWVNEEKQVVMARFSREEVQTILNVGKIELSIIGWLTDATVFEGRDVIRVVHKGGGKLAKYGKASNPNPIDGATGVSIYTAYLSWTAGSGATSHDVYFGTSSLPPLVCNQTATIFEPGMMDYDATYYWRIDEVNKWDKTTGQIWSFTTFKPPPPPPPPP